MAEASFFSSMFAGARGYVKGILGGGLTGAIVGGILGMFVGMPALGAAIGACTLGFLSGSVGLVRDVVKDMHYKRHSSIDIDQLTKLSFARGVELGQQQTLAAAEEPSLSEESSKFRDMILQQQRAQAKSKDLH